MVCSYCGKNIESNEVTVNGLNYCNKLCSYLMQKKDETQDEVEGSDKSGSQGLFLQDLDFHINLNDIGGKKLLLRASYFFGPRLFLDGKKLKPYKRVRFYKRKRYYHVPNDKGGFHEVILNLRPLDAVPSLTINGLQIDIVRKLTWYEYALIGLPISFYFLGGMIGAIIGGGAIFTNSILLRKINHKIFRYSMVVTNLVVATLIFYEAIIFALPYITEFQFKLESNLDVQSKNVKTATLTKHIWEVNKIISADNPSAVVQTNVITMRSYFFYNGDYTQFLSNGTFFKGTWKIDSNERFITITQPNIVEKGELLSISDHELTIRLDRLTLYFKAVY